jgi:hypothetical protein
MLIEYQPLKTVSAEDSAALRRSLDVARRVDIAIVVDGKQKYIPVLARALGEAETCPQS